MLRRDDESVDPGSRATRNTQALPEREPSIGTSIADFIKASGHECRANRPATWLQHDRLPSLFTCTAGTVHTWVFRCDKAVVHHAAPPRGACVVHEIMDGHRPVVWLANRYSAQQRHANRQQTCLAHLARDVAYALKAGDDPLALRLKLWLDGAFALARTITTSAPSTVIAEHRKLERSLGDILAAPDIFDLARDIQNRMRRARDQLLIFAAFPGRVETHNNACERDLHSAVIQRKNTNGARAMWSAKGEAAVRTVVGTARITSGADTFSTVLKNYQAVPTNARALSAFRDRVVELWRRSLTRRSQRDSATWKRMRKLASDWLPRPRILNPWPSERFAVKHPRWEPNARIGPLGSVRRALRNERPYSDPFGKSLNAASIEFHCGPPGH